MLTLSCSFPPLEEYPRYYLRTLIQGLIHCQGEDPKPLNANKFPIFINEAEVLPDFPLLAVGVVLAQYGEELLKTPPKDEMIDLTRWSISKDDLTWLAGRCLHLTEAPATTTYLALMKCVGNVFSRYTAAVDPLQPGISKPLTNSMQKILDFCLPMTVGYRVERDVERGNFP